MKKILVILICLCVFSSGCITTTSNMYLGDPIFLEDTIKNYEIGKIKTVSTGSVMVEKSEGKKMYLLKVSSDSHWVYNIGDRAEYSFWGKSKGIDSRTFFFFSPIVLLYSGQLEAIRAYKESRGEPVVFKNHVKEPIFDTVVDAEPVPAEELIITERISEDNGKMLQLIYNGKQDKNTINLVCRDYAENFQRPKSSQELIYDLDETSLILFRDYEIRVEEATSNGITFIVEKE